MYISVSAAGDRLRIRNAIAKLALANAPVAAVTPFYAKHEATAASAERRQLGCHILRLWYRVQQPRAANPPLAR